MKPKKTVSAYILLVGIMGLSIAGGVLAFQIFSAATKTQLTPEQTLIIKPIEGSISQEVIFNLEKRTQVSEDEMSRTEEVFAVSPSPNLVSESTPSSSQAILTE